MDIKRKLVVEGLIKVDNSGFSNLVFSSIIEGSQLSPQDKSFAAKTFYGTIERRITLNYILQKFISKPLDKIDREVLAILQSGLYQILYMNSVPSHAAINQAVALCPVFKKTSAKGLVNAVLRKCLSFDLSCEQFDDEISRLSVIYSISKDIVKLIKNDYEDCFEEILKGMFTSPKLTLKVNTIKTSVEDFLNLLQDKHVKFEKTSIEGCISINYRGAVTTIPGFRDGMCYVQGLTSQYEILASQINKNDNVLDLCAAPGGKSFAAAIALDNTGSVTSCDPNESRLPLIASNAEKLGIKNINVMCNNGEVYNAELCNKDVVICDVPCSGIGIIPKKPDLRYKNLNFNENLCKLQYDILSTAAKYVKLNGKLVYSTCTINKKENEQVVEKFLKENPEFSIKEQNCPIENTINKNGMITFLSHLTQCDGFFIAVMEKMW